MKRHSVISVCVAQPWVRPIPNEALSGAPFQTGLFLLRFSLTHDCTCRFR